MTRRISPGDLRVRSLTLSLYIMLLAGLQGLSAAGYAAVVVDIYRTQEPVPDQSENARSEALAAGLISVVDRATGRSDWRQLLSEQQLVSNTQVLLEQFGYVQSGDLLQIDMRFSGNAVNSLLAQSGISVWGENRPRVLFWIASESGSRRSVLSENTRPAMVDRLQKALDYWGIPGLTPLMDIEDNARLNVSDLWGFFEGPVDQASKRYASDAIVMARVNKDAGGRWTVLWQLRAEGEKIGEGAFETGTSREWIKTLTAKVSSTLASIYAVQIVSSDSMNNVRLTVRGIQTFKDYVDVYRLLKSLAPVKDALAYRITAGEVQFDLSLNGFQEQVVDHLALHQELTPTLADGINETGIRLVYLWQPAR